MGPNPPRVVSHHVTDDMTPTHQQAGLQAWNAWGPQRLDTRDLSLYVRHVDSVSDIQQLAMQYDDKQYIFPMFPTNVKANLQGC